MARIGEWRGAYRVLVERSEGNRPPGRPGSTWKDNIKVKLNKLDGTLWSRLIRLRTGISCRSQWPRSLRRRSAAAPLQRSWVLIPPVAWMFVCCECCVLSGRGLCDELITRPEESYRLWCVVVYDLENFANEEVMTRVGSQRHREKNIYVYMTTLTYV
jgi:hypothetical protein